MKDTSDYIAEAQKPEESNVVGEPAAAAAYGMETSVFNPVQLHLLKMFSYAKSPWALDEVRKALCTYFAKRVEDDMDALWDSGEWSEEKNKSILKEHLRTPYRKR